MVVLFPEPFGTMALFNLVVGNLFLGATSIGGFTQFGAGLGGDDLVRQFFVIGEAADELKDQRHVSDSGGANGTGHARDLTIFGIRKPAHQWSRTGTPRVKNR